MSLNTPVTPEFNIALATALSPYVGKELSDKEYDDVCSIYHNLLVQYNTNDCDHKAVQELIETIVLSDKLEKLGL